MWTVLLCIWVAIPYHITNGILLLDYRDDVSFFLFFVFVFFVSFLIQEEINIVKSPWQHEVLELVNLKYDPISAVELSSH